MKQSPIFEFGSFRDPSGAVFYYQGRVFRSLDAESFDILKGLADKGILGDLQQRGYIVPSRCLDDGDAVSGELKIFFPGNRHYIEHEKIPFISYPCEWTFSMLADAAILYLKLQIYLVKKGYSLKDASAFNIQFMRGAPVFIDLPSIELPARLDIWIAYGQFCQMFLYPLLLQRIRHIDLKGSLAANINGLSVDYAAGVFGFPATLRPDLFIDVFLQHLLGKIAGGKTEALKHSIDKGSGDLNAQLINLERLERKITKLSASYKLTAHWLKYSRVNSYSDQAQAQKKRYISDFLKENSVSSVLDLGCNTGDYSIIASEAGAEVVAVDGDHDCVDRLYGRAKKEKRAILPLWMDIANPTPPMGFDNRERRGFSERINCDCVFALALLHHLLVVSRVPLPALRDFFFKLAGRFLVIEFVPPQDAMFKRILGLREDIYAHLTENYFLSVFSEKFELLNKQSLKETQRVLFAFKKKDEK